MDLVLPCSLVVSMYLLVKHALVLSLVFVPVVAWSWCSLIQMLVMKCGALYVWLSVLTYGYSLPHATVAI